MQTNGLREIDEVLIMAIRASFHGSLGRNAEVKTFGDNKVTKFSVANNTGYGDKKKTVWVDCDLWGNRGEKLANYLMKGQSVLIYGEIELHEYQAKDGSNKAVLRCRVNDLELIGSKKDHDKSEEPGSYEKPAQANAVTMDDDIPF